MTQEEEMLRNKHLKPWSYYPFTHEDLEEGMIRIANITMKRLSRREKEYILSRFTLVELFQELHRRANQDVEEDEEIDWEDELGTMLYQSMAKKYPHFFGKREVN